MPFLNNHNCIFILGFKIKNFYKENFNTFSCMGCKYWQKNCFQPNDKKVYLKDMLRTLLVSFCCGNSMYFHENQKNYLKLPFFYFNL